MWIIICTRAKIATAKQPNLADGKRGWFPRGWFHDGGIIYRLKLINSKIFDIFWIFQYMAAGDL